MGKRGPQPQPLDMPKYCRECGSYKERTLEYWHKNSSKYDGLSDLCKSCRNFLRKKEPEPKPVQLTKVCPKCKIEKPLTPEFWWRNRSDASGYQAYCKTCAYTPTGGKGGKLIPAGPTRICPKCNVEKPYTTEYFFRNQRATHGLSGWCKECNTKAANGAKLQYRIMVLTHYSKGTPKCFCCGETEVTVLNLHHMDGGGTQHRKQITIGFYPWIIQNGFPEGYGVLCRNCDWCYRVKGHCYHT